jgi:hypothetical protein
MSDNTSQGPHRQEATGIPLCLVRGDASPEELAAILAVLATIPSSSTGDGGPDPADRSTSRWSTRQRMFQSTYPHGPGGWRASALPH